MCVGTEFTNSTGDPPLFVSPSMTTGMPQMNAFPKQEMRDERRAGAEAGRKREIGAERGRRGGKNQSTLCAMALMEALSFQLYGASRPPLFSTAATMS